MLRQRSPGRFPALLALTILVLPWAGTRADEGGESFWLLGSYSGYAAVPPKPGWYLPIQIYYDSGSEEEATKYQSGESLNEGLGSKLATVLLTPTWAPDETWFGGQPSFSLTFGFGWNTSSSDLSSSTVSAGIPIVERSDSDTGGVDLNPQFQIAWTRGVNNGMTYLTANVPVGAYNSRRMSNLGLGHTAIDVGGAYTYSNDRSRLEASAALGFTYNGENTATNYLSGFDSHLGWDVSGSVSRNWQLGVTGYVYYQLTGDRGTGDQVGSFKSRVASVGPEVEYSFTVAGQPWSANVRGYKEFWAQNRLEGFTVFASVSIPLAKAYRRPAPPDGPRP